MTLCCYVINTEVGTRISSVKTNGIEHNVQYGLIVAFDYFCR